MFYESLGEDPTARQEQALMEFFSRGVVGTLSRANRKYLANNLAREKVFLQLLKSLRELFGLVFERDVGAAMESSNAVQLEEQNSANNTHRDGRTVGCDHWQAHPPGRSPPGPPGVGCVLNRSEPRWTAWSAWPLGRRCHDVNKEVVL